MFEVITMAQFVILHFCKLTTVGKSLRMAVNEVRRHDFGI